VSILLSLGCLYVLRLIKEAFVASCRKLIGVDGCHLKGLYKGILLRACGLDGDNPSFLIAYAIIDQECKDNWCSFLNSLRGVIGNDLDGEYIFIADRCKVIPLNFIFFPSDCFENCE